jgi:hypothetical protein
MALVQVSARLDPDKLKRAKKALDLVTEKAAHDWVIQRYSGVGKRNAFKAN